MKNRLYMIIFLTLIWCGFSRNFAFMHIVFGLAISTAISFFANKGKTPANFYFIKFIKLVIVTSYSLLISSIEVALEVLSIKKNHHPAILIFKLNCKSDAEIMMLSNLITLTPGTLTIKHSEDKKYLYIHSMFAKDNEAVRQDIKNNLEPMVMGVLGNGRN